MQPLATARRDSGLTLVEVLVATAIFTLVSVAAAHLLVWAVRALWSTGAETVALAAAQAKMEELQSREWRFDQSGNRVSDVAASPVDALLRDTTGYVDYLDAGGESIAGDGQRPAHAVFVRRWSVRPLAMAPEDTLVFQVLVVPSSRADTAPVSSWRSGGDALLTAARTRVR
jgi:prepilin-type N-terminal cleavage/methylation domain-containing protein